MGGTIWCYTTDTGLEKEECVPVDFCKNTLSSKGVTSKIVQYDDSPIVLSIKNDLLKNTQELKCPITKCKLMIADCSVSYLPSDLSISTDGNFDVSL